MELFEKAKSFFGGSKDITGQHIQLKVCMMGPRGVGKTTILTSIFHDSDAKLNKDGLYFSAIGETALKLEDGYKKLAEIFKEIPDENATPLPGIDASKGVTEFQFKLGLKGDGAHKDKRASVGVTIKDFPGEFVDETHPEHGQVIQFIKESQVIMLAVDSVHLIEENGKYNESRNQSSYMCDKISSILKQLDSTEHKLILIVPLKCEKYFMQKSMSNLTDKVCTAYKSLIEEIRTDYKDKIGLYITPIQTLGGVVFSKFGKDATGTVSIGIDNCPNDVQYRFFRAIPDRKPMYMPVYCVQPMYYLVSFALNQYKRNQNKGGVLGSIFKGLFSLFSSDLIFYQACQNFVSHIKTSGDGYVILNNPNLINSNS